MTTVPNDSSVAPAATAMPNVHCEITELEGIVLFQMTMTSGAQFGFYMGKAEEYSFRGPVEKTGRFGFVPEAPLTVVEAYALAERLKRPLISFADYALGIRCSSDWDTVHPPRKPEEFTPEAMEAKRKKGSRSSKNPRPTWVEAVKDAGQLHTNEFVIDARSSEAEITNEFIINIDYTNHTKECGLLRVPAKELGIQGKLVFADQSFDSAGNSTIRFEKDADSELYTVKVDPNCLRIASPEQVQQLLGHRLKESCPETRSAGYFPIVDGKLDLDHRVTDFNDLGEDLFHYYTMVEFKPGFVGPVGTGGYFRSRVDPSMNMSYLGKKGAAFRLN